MFTLISWVEETNRLILNLILDSRSETDIRIAQAVFPACLQLEIKHFTMKSLILAQDER